MKLWTKIQENLVASIATLVAGVILTAFLTVGDWTKKGKELEDNKILDSRIMSVMLSDSAQTKFVAQDKIKNFVHKVRLEAFEDARHQDSLKVKMSAYLSTETGMTKEALMDTLAVILNERKVGKKFITNNQCIKNSKQYGRGRSVLTGM